MNYLKYIAGALIVVAIVGAYLYPKALPPKAGALTASSSFGDAKIADMVIVPSTGTATTSSILNTDSTDRIIVSTEETCANLGSSFVAYTGAGLSTLTIKMATTSTAGSSIIGAIGNSNLVLNAGNVISTTTVFEFYNASSTPGNTLTGTNGTDVVRVWGANTYLTAFTNATNTAICNVGVRYMNSATTTP